MVARAELNARKKVIVDSRELERGSGMNGVVVPSFLPSFVGFGVGERSYSNFEAT